MKITLSLYEIKKAVGARYDIDPEDFTLEIADLPNCTPTSPAVIAEKIIHTMRHPPFGGESVLNEAGDMVLPVHIVPAVKTLRTVINGLGLGDAKRAVDDWKNFIDFVRWNGLPPVHNFVWHY